MAEAAGTTPGRVALQSLHQHSAPVLDADAMGRLHGDDTEPVRQHIAFTTQMAERTATAIREALPKLKPVVRVVGSRAKADRLASNRRVPQADGSLLVRGSATRDPKLQEAPEGLIDAMRRSARVASGGAMSESEKLDTTVDLRSLKPAGIAWDQSDLRFTVRDDGPFAAAALREQLQPGRPFNDRLKAAEFLAWANRLNAGHRVTVSRLKVGPLQLVHLPGEPFVEFQLFAQQAADDSFVCVAGYGECGVWYFGPDSIFRDRGGYEQTWSFTGTCQAAVETVLNQLVSPRKSQ